jgi:hypothetical protein
MSDMDPHVHVEQKVAEAAADVRNVVASTLGVAVDAPGVVTTGCGIQVPYAMTSRHPASVTCLACRDHAHREYRLLADQFERLGRLPELLVSGITGDQLAEAVEHLRDLVARFAD